MTCVAEHFAYSNPLGTAIRTIRLERGMSMRELAEAVGLSVPYICQQETGTAKSSLSLERLTQIAEALNVDPALFLEPALRVSRRVTLRMYPDDPPIKRAFALALSRAWADVDEDKATALMTALGW